MTATKIKITSGRSFRMTGQSLQILGVRVNSTSASSVLRVVTTRLDNKKKLWIVTPNPEFIVACQKDNEFEKTLNKADLAIPDGFGLVLASRLLNTKPLLKERVAGSDVVKEILDNAQIKGWKIVIVGARRGDPDQIEELIKNLKERFPGLKVEALELAKDWQKESFDIIFACQGMKEQEKWILDNMPKVKATIFMGVGGSLDFLAGFTKRAPKIIRDWGLEWLWRVWQNPRHLKRVFIASIVFPLLVLKEKLRI